MANQIVFSSEELELAKTNLQDSLKILKNDIESSLNSDFSVLEQLDLFTNGLSKIRKQTTSLSESHDSLVKKFERHENDLRQKEDDYSNIVENYRSGRSGGSNYAGESVRSREDEVYDKEEGKQITNTYLAQVVPELTSDSKLQMLKNILIYNEATVSSLFGIADKANLLVYQLKKMLKDDTAALSEITIDDEKTLQKIILESVVKEEKNLFMEIDEKSYLAGLPFFKQVALENKIKVSDLLIDKENEELLMKAFNDLYFKSSQLENIKEEEVLRVKEYFDNLAKTKNMKVEDLLSDTKYMEVIKEGVLNDSKGEV